MVDEQLRREVQDLRTIGAAWRGVLRGLQTSPLEAPFGYAEPFPAAVTRLRRSALIDVGGVGSSYKGLLDELSDLIVAALYWFEPLRTVEGTNRLEWDDDQGLLVGDVSRSRFPASVHRDARRLYWHIKTLSCFHYCDPPNEHAMLSAGIWPLPPLNVSHAGALVALAAAAGAIHALENILRQWRTDFVQIARGKGIDFDWHSGSGLWTSIMQAIRTDAECRACEVDELNEARAKVAAGLGWLEHARVMHESKERAKVAVDRAIHEDAAKRRAAAAINGKVGGDHKLELAEVNKAKVEKAWHDLTPTQQQSVGVAGIVAGKVKLSQGPVRAHLKALGLRVPTKKRQKGTAE